MNPKKLQNIPLWKLALRVGSTFTFIFIILELIWKISRNGGILHVQESLQNGHWKMYVLSKIIMLLAYGFSVGYLLKRNATKG